MNTVSSKLAAYLQGTGLLASRTPQSVVGCCVDTDRFYFDPEERSRRRRELGFDGRFVVAYCGSLAAYQRPDAIADAFAAIRAERPDAHFFAITREAKPLLNLLLARGVSLEHITTRAVSHDQVASYLMAGDIGLLLREDTLTNRVASPVKFGEYLRCGLPVIITPYVGDFAELAEKEAIGETVAFPIIGTEVRRATRNLAERLDREADSYRRRCSELARTYLSWEEQLDRLIGLYATLACPTFNQPTLSGSDNGSDDLD